jgi:aminoglycoside phosphotransferase (APT) family kinase protein
MGTPPSEIEINVPLISSLLDEQHPDLKHLPIYLVDSGWDNAIFRLGEQLSVRLPRRQVAAQLIENEQIWLPIIAKRLHIPVPIPDRLGQPGQGYPWKWSILPWLAGVTADRDKISQNQAKNWALFLRSLHVPAPSNAPLNLVRGVPLNRRKAVVEERMQRLKEETNLINPEINNIWQEALNAPIDVEPVWLHGDLHPRNILVENGKISGVIDWGDMTSGDIATDLASIWMLFSDRSLRQQVLWEYGNISEATLLRAKGWAIIFAVVLLDTGMIDSPRHAFIGEKTLRHVYEDG